MDKKRDFGWSVLTLFFCSGATALVYEVVWSKYLSQMFGSTIQAQQELIRQIYQENQQLLQYRFQHPPTAQQEQQQPAADQPSQGDGSSAPSNPATGIHMADGCLGGVCA